MCVSNSYKKGGFYFGCGISFVKKMYEKKKATQKKIFIGFVIFIFPFFQEVIFMIINIIYFIKILSFTRCHDLCILFYDEAKYIIFLFLHLYNNNNVMYYSMLV